MRLKHSFPLFALLAGVMLAVSPRQLSAQVKEMSADELATRSEIVARGTVKSLKAQWVGNRERIVTLVTLEVEEYIKGQGGASTLTLVNPGGEIDGVGELYTHIASFREDEDVIVFAEKDHKGQYHVTGGQQGKFRIEKDELTGKHIVSGRQPVEDFEARVKQSVKETGH